MTVRVTHLMCAAALLAPVPLLAAPPALLPTNDPNAFAFPAAPPNFDPIHATASSLAAYGFPPRPRLFSARYDAWAKIVSAARHPIFPVVQPTTRRAAPIPAWINNPLAQAGTQTSPAWSGISLLNQSTSFGPASLFQIWGEWNVPKASTAFGTGCSQAVNGYDAWISLDGFGTPDMLTSGIGAQVCPTVYYDAFYQWYPGASHVVANFTVSIGDEVSDIVWVTGPTAGQTFMTNLTTGAYWGLKITPPAGTALIGNSAEWIMGRECKAQPCAMALSNYGAEYFANTIAFYNINAPTGVGPNGDPQTTPFLFSMLDSNASPISSVAYYQGNYSMFGLHVTGSAK